MRVKREERGQEGKGGWRGKWREVEGSRRKKKVEESRRSRRARNQRETEAGSRKLKSRRISFCHSVSEENK